MASAGRRDCVGSVARPQLTAEVDGLALHEFATLPPQPWEPYVAGGDWRAALEAWYRETLALHDRTRQQHLEERASEPRRSRLLDPDQAATVACRDADFEAIKAINYARKRDRIEAWYQAGLAAGGVDEDWAGWYRDRIAAWDRRQDAIYDPARSSAGPARRRPGAWSTSRRSAPG